LLVTVAAVALLGSQGAVAAPQHDGCDHHPCVSATSSSEVPSEPDSAAHLPCLHVHGCGGGGALGLGGMLFAVVGGRVRPPLPDTSIRRRPPSQQAPPSAILVGGIQRPPQFAS